MGADDALATLSGHNKKVGVLRWNPTSPVLATSSIDKTIKVWLTAAIPMVNPYCSCGLTRVNTIKVWDIETGQAKFSTSGFKVPSPSCLLAAAKACMQLPRRRCWAASPLCYRRRRAVLALLRFPPAARVCARGPLVARASAAPTARE